MFEVVLVLMTAFWSVVAWKQFTGRVFEPAPAKEEQK